MAGGRGAGHVPALPVGQPLAIALLFCAVAALSFWLGTKSWTLFPSQQATDAVPAATPIPLPAPEPATTEPEMLNEPELIPAPLVSPSPRAPSPAQPATGKARPKASADEASDEKKAAGSPRAPWPVRKVEGSAGRLVQVGTFSTRRQAKRGWNALMRVNPSLQRLPAMVVPVQSKRDSKTYYRLQMGTTSQAHSVVLCQRLRMIGQSCIVTAEAVEKEAE
jgi:hypothetical protein